MKFSCIDTVSFASLKEIGVKLIILDLLMDIDRRARNNKLKLSGISRNLWISWKFSMLIKLLPQYYSHVDMIYVCVDMIFFITYSSSDYSLIFGIKLDNDNTKTNDN